ncbi:restriction endonuclease [Kitasatospora herbaricolor]|uniref:restriction endonuclease n=2 Tax=Kitasatospora herbaricolor TaxID=68217 RepID=UPI0036DE1BF4
MYAAPIPVAPARTAEQINREYLEVHWAPTCGRLAVEMDAYRQDPRAYGLDRIVDLVTAHEAERLDLETNFLIRFHTQINLPCTDGGYDTLVDLGNALQEQAERLRKQKAQQSEQARQQAIQSGIFDRMDSQTFEEAIATLLRRDGHHHVDRSGKAGDLGADVTAITKLGSKIVVQCKRYDQRRPVGSPDVQRFAGTCFAVHRADLALLVTTSSFTPAAASLANRIGILLLNGDQVRQWQAGELDPATGL